MNTQRKVVVRRTLSGLPRVTEPSWRLASLAQLGDREFSRRMLTASAGDPFDTSTPETALDDLHELMEAAGTQFDAGSWFAVEDAEGPIGVLLPQRFPDHPTRGTLFYLGIDPARRGQGLGRRLHRLGLQLLAERGVIEYVGSTDATNVAMLAIFEANGCQSPVSRRR